MKESQREIILKELLSDDSITPYDAWRHYHITKLADIVFKLRNQGYVIKDHNNGIPFSDYYIEKNKKYIIQNKVTGEYLKRILLNPDYLEWTNNINEAVSSRAGLFRVVQLLQKEEKMKICVCEQKEPE